MLDGVLVFVSLIDILVSLASTGGNKIFGILRVLRLLRTLRPLRLGSLFISCVGVFWVTLSFLVLNSKGCTAILLIGQLFPLILEYI